MAQRRTIHFVYADEWRYPVQITYQEWEGGSWQTRYIEEAELDDAGRPVEIVTEETENGSADGASREVLSYNGDGSISQSVMYYDFWGDGTWEPESRNTWHYDAYGTVIAVVSDFWDDWFDEWWEDARILYAYNDEFNNISRTTQYYDIDWVNSTRSVFSHDRQGNVIEWIRQAWSDNGWYYLGKTESQFENGCLLIREAKFDWTDGQWERLSRDSYEYNGGGVPVTKLTQTWSGTLWENSVRYLFGDPAITGVSGSVSLPGNVELMQNYPNPFNPSTTIRFTIAERRHVTIEVYDAAGRIVRSLVDEELHAGEHTVVFDALNVSSGVYLYRLSAGDAVAARRMILLR
jgi:hypothetical protein